MDLGEAINRFLDSAVVERNLAKPTIRAYSGDLRLLQRELGRPDVAGLTVDHLRGFLDRLSASRPYQDTTVRRKMATMKVFFSFLEEEGFLSDSPARRLHGRYAIVRRLPKVMSLREIRALLRTCRREVVRSAEPVAGMSGLVLTDSPAFRACRDLAMFEVLFSTGMRIGEMVALDLTDVNQRERSVRILGKGRRERMTFISSDEAVGALETYIAHRSQFGGTALFLNKSGRRLSIYSVENAFRKYCRLARIKRGYTPHCLRHTMATMLLSNGADIRSVQEILGHRTIATTQIYTEVSIAQKRRTMMRFHQRNRMRLDGLRSTLTPLALAGGAGVG